MSGPYEVEVTGTAADPIYRVKGLRDYCFSSKDAEGLASLAADCANTGYAAGRAEMKAEAAKLARDTALLLLVEHPEASTALSDLADELEASDGK